MKHFYFLLHLPLHTSIPSSLSSNANHPALFTYANHPLPSYITWLVPLPLALHDKEVYFYEAYITISDFWFLLRINELGLMR